MTKRGVLDELTSSGNPDLKLYNVLRRELRGSKFLTRKRCFQNFPYIRNFKFWLSRTSENFRGLFHGTVFIIKKFRDSTKVVTRSRLGSDSSRGGRDLWT